jgi:hypothetical protein
VEKMLEFIRSFFRKGKREKKINWPITNVVVDTAILDIHIVNSNGLLMEYRPILQFAFDIDTQQIMGFRLITDAKIDEQQNISLSPCSVGPKARIEKFIHQLKVDLKKAKGQMGQDILSKRQIIEDQIIKGLIKSRTELRKQYKSTYSCLVCCDKDWLDSKLPIDIRNEINYDTEYDEEICAIIKETYFKLLDTGHKISKGNFEKNPKLRTRIRVLNRYPISKAYLESIIEPTEQYDQRRIRQAIDELIQVSQNFTYFTIAKKAKVSMSRFEQLKVMADEYLSLLSHPKLKLYNSKQK